MARILFLDDEDALVFLVTRMLTQLGHDVRGYTSAQEALSAFRSDPAGFDLVLTDLALPGTNGLAFAGQILTVRPDTIIAITSGFVEPRDCETAQRMGVRVVAKPGTMEQATSMLAVLLGAAGQAGGR